MTEKEAAATPVTTTTPTEWEDIVAPTEKDTKTPLFPVGMAYGTFEVKTVQPKDAEEMVRVKEDGQNLQKLQDRMKHVCKVYRYAASHYERLYVCLTLLSLLCTSAVSVLQAVPGDGLTVKVVVAALGAAATFITGVSTYTQAQTKSENFKENVKEIKGYIEQIHFLLYHLAGTVKRDKAAKRVEDLYQKFEATRERATVPSWIAVFLANSSQADDLDDESNDTGCTCCGRPCCAADSGCCGSSSTIADEATQASTDADNAGTDSTGADNAGNDSSAAADGNDERV